MEWLNPLGIIEEIPPEEEEEFLQEEEARKSRFNDFGSARVMYIREYRPEYYHQLVTTGKLFETIKPLQEQAEYRYRMIVKQMVEKQGTHELRATDTQKWASEFMQVQASAREIVMSEMIYV